MGQTRAMPLIEVTHAPRVSGADLDALAAVLPHAVSVAVACAEEPYDRALQPGDVDLRFRTRGPRDSPGLDVVVEVRSKWFASRAENRQERCDLVLAAVTETVGHLGAGVYLTLPVAAWSQTD